MYHPSMPGETAIFIRSRWIELSHGDVPIAAAEAVLKIRVPDTDQERFALFADKSNRGTLTADEAEEYDALISAAELLTLWKSKARIALAKRNAAP